MSRIHNGSLPKIAIIGRSGVGKSSIFNRLLERRKAIVKSGAGVTRDRLSAPIRMGGSSFILIDTGGIIPCPKDRIAQLVYKQSRLAIEESDAVIFVCDATSGLTYQDEHIAGILKESGKKVFLVINKLDKENMTNEIYDFYRLGIGRPYGLSAIHNRGLGELSSDITAYLWGVAKSPAEKTVSPHGLKVAIVGKPNVGKSSYVNRILNEERVLVDETPGTTRDSVDINVRRDGGFITLIDTAGMKHKRKIKDVVGIFSLAKAKESIRRSDVVIVMIDIMQGFLRDDIAVVDYVIKEGKPCVLLVNKTDLAEGLDADEYRKALAGRFKPLEWIPVLFTSCKNKQNIIRSLDMACDLNKNAKVAIPTPDLNNLLTRLQRMRPHPSIGRMRPKVYYATQTGSSPQRFLLFVADPKTIRQEYLRFIENSLRKRFGLFGVPLRFELKAKG